MSWFSELIKKVTTAEAVDFYVSGPLPMGSGPATATPLVTDQCYVAVRAVSLRLPNTRQKVFERVYGIVHAFASLPSRRGTETQFAAATMPGKLAGVDPKNLQNVITIDKLLAGPTPWSGGDLNLQIGLFSVVSENLAGAFLETMTKLTETVGVSFATAAKPYVDTLKFGIEQLTRAAGSVKLEIGLDQSFKPPAAGLYAIVATPVGKLSGKSLSLDPADKKLLVNGAHYTDKPYLVYSIESSPQRSDWGKIPDLQRSYTTIVQSIEANKRDEAAEAFATFTRLAAISPDLIAADADALIEKVKNEMQRAFGKAATSGTAPAVPAFHELGLYQNR